MSAFSSTGDFDPHRAVIERGIAVGPAVKIVELARRARASTPPPEVDEEEPPASPEPPPRAVQYPAALWDARPWLAELHAYCLARGYAPDPVLATCLARFAAALPRGTTLDTGILSPQASLNLFVAIIGDASSGKSEAMAAARPMVPLKKEGNVGSGEGLAEAFMGYDRDSDDKKKPERKQVLYNLFLTLDEGRDLYRLDERKGATILQRLRSAWTGQPLGEMNASDDRKRNATDYNLGIAIGWQRHTVRPLLNDVDSGTPQRFLFCSVNARQRPTGRRTAAQPLFEQPPAPPRITFCPTAREEIADFHYSDAPKDPFRGRSMLMRAKVGALIAAIEFRQQVTTADWALARTIVSTSETIVEELLHEAKEQKATEDEERILQRAMTAEMSALAARRAEDNARSDATKVLAYVGKHPGASRRQVKKSAFYITRRGFAEPAIDALISEGRLVEENGKLRVR